MSRKPLATLPTTAPEGVQPVKPGYPLAHVRIGAHEVAGQYWQGHPHDQGYRRQRAEGQGESDQRHLTRREREVGAAEDGRDDAEGQRHEQGKSGDGDFKQPVDDQRPPQLRPDRRPEK